MSGERADRLGKPLAVLAIVVAVGTVVASIVMMGGPEAQRRVRIDANRIDDLAAIDTAVRAHVVEHEALPASLAALEHPGRVLMLEDREGRGAYEYAIVDKKRFRLCAFFDTDTAQRPTTEYPASLPKWAHGKGRQCFTLTLSPKDAEAVHIESP